MQLYFSHSTIAVAQETPDAHNLISRLNAARLPFLEFAWVRTLSRRQLNHFRHDLFALASFNTPTTPIRLAHDSGFDDHAPSIHDCFLLRGIFLLRGYTFWVTKNGLRAGKELDFGLHIDLWFLFLFFPFVFPCPFPQAGWSPHGDEFCQWGLGNCTATESDPRRAFWLGLISIVWILYTFGIAHAFTPTLPYFDLRGLFSQAALGWNQVDRRYPPCFRRPV
ncbi:uncharacterized protein BCR38DRAFT_112678 [Pseudomassariella vexata]|uniref:Uncharacterized protein n=1 Tax=Pseudomassariella vexata TaxID=1141098 RepID=A0A1Y2DCD7_9PEZI|nr:uncharacterized protein BCR38DRAFT_112678 [Pseudomassariella vexata]ORY56929.1 hypothetical protein BCR38DRAFT_112678 [Pseudomassariella vexata]